MLTREQYKELKRYEDSEIPIGDEGLSEIEEYLLKCGYIEASRMDVQSCPGIVQFYDSAYQITELGRQALSEYRHERYGKAFQVFLVLLGAAVALLADILLSLFANSVYIAQNSSNFSCCSRADHPVQFQAEGRFLLRRSTRSLLMIGLVSDYTVSLRSWCPPLFRAFTLPSSPRRDRMEAGKEV